MGTSIDAGVMTELPPNVLPAMLRAGFWLDGMPSADELLLSDEALRAFNARVPDLIGIPALGELPDAFSAGDVRATIAQYERPAKIRYGLDGEPLSGAYFDALIANATPDLPEQVPVRFGLTVRRTDLRAFPTADVITSQPYDFAFDRIQEAAVDVGKPVAVLATSRDGRWYFGLTPHYWGWLRVEDVALGLREQVMAYAEADPYLMVTGSRGLVACVGGGITPQMGTRLPLREDTGTAYRVAVPMRTPAGTLVFVDGWAARQESTFARGALPLTRRTLFEQAFKLLGEVYSWGGSRLGIFGRDCSRLVQDVYATAGVALPRNGDQQGRVCHEVVAFTDTMSAAERTAALVERVPPGAILVLPGHVMLYLGAVDGVPFALHDTSSSGYNGVIVSDLSLGEAGPNRSLLQRLTHAVTVG